MCYRAERKMKKMFEEETFGQSRRNGMMDLTDFDIIFQRVSQIRIVGNFIVTVCVTEQKGKRKKCLKKKHLVGQEEKG